MDARNPGDCSLTRRPLSAISVSHTFAGGFRFSWELSRLATRMKDPKVTAADDKVWDVSTMLLGRPEEEGMDLSAQQNLWCEMQNGPAQPVDCWIYHGHSPRENLYPPRPKCLLPTQFVASGSHFGPGSFSPSRLSTALLISVSREP